MSSAPYGDVAPLEASDAVGQAAGQGHTPRMHTDQHQVVDATVALQDLVCNAAERPLDLVLGHQLLFGHEKSLLPRLARGCTLPYPSRGLGHCSPRTLPASRDWN